MSAVSFIRDPELCRARLFPQRRNKPLTVAADNDGEKYTAFLGPLVSSSVVGTTDAPLSVQEGNVMPQEGDPLNRRLRATSLITPAKDAAIERLNCGTALNHHSLWDNEAALGRKALGQCFRIGA